MRKTVLAVLGALLIAGSTVQMTAAAERHVARWSAHPYPRASSFATLMIPWLGHLSKQQSLSDYSEGHVISAPAGR